MMKMKLLCAAIAVAVSANSFALELYKAKIVKHKEWTTGNIKVLFKSGNGAHPMPKMPSLNLHNTPNGEITASATAPGGEGVAGSPFVVTGINTIHVYNDTQAAQDYEYTFGVCLNLDDHTAQCGYYIDTVEVEAGGYVYEEKEPAVTIAVDQPGFYTTQAFSGIYNADLNLNLYASGTGSLLMSDNNQKVKK